MAPSFSNPLFSSPARKQSVFLFKAGWFTHNYSIICRLHVAIVSTAYFLDGVTFCWMILPSYSWMVCRCRIAVQHCTLIFSHWKQLEKLNKSKHSFFFFLSNFQQKRKQLPADTLNRPADKHETWGRRAELTPKLLVVSAPVSGGLCGNPCDMKAEQGVGENRLATHLGGQ